MRYKDHKTQETTLIIFGKMHFLLISENEFTHEIKRDGITSFTDFTCFFLKHSLGLITCTILMIFWCLFVFITMLPLWRHNSLTVLIVLANEGSGITRCLFLMRFWCLSKRKKLNNAVTSQLLIVLIVLANRGSLLLVPHLGSTG